MVGAAIATAGEVGSNISEIMDGFGKALKEGMETYIHSILFGKNATKTPCLAKEY